MTTPDPLLTCLHALEAEIADLHAMIAQKNQTILDGAAYARHVEQELARVSAYLQTVEQHAADLTKALDSASEYARMLETRIFDLNAHLAQYRAEP
jgi:chromosome segregation ATPase